MNDAITPEEIQAGLLIKIVGRGKHVNGMFNEADLYGKAEPAGARNASGAMTAKVLSAMFQLTSTPLRRRTQMLTTKAVEKAIEMYEGGATEAAVTEATGISRNVGETERLLREVTLAGVLEAAAQALRSGRGLIGDGAEDVVREVWHNYPGAGMKVGAP
jgi:hypothetical protein